MAQGDLYVTPDGDLVWDTNEEETGSALISDDSTDERRCCDCDDDGEPPVIPINAFCDECRRFGFAPHCCYESICEDVPGDDQGTVGWPPLLIQYAIDEGSMPNQNCSCIGPMLSFRGHLTGQCRDEQGRSTQRPTCLWANDGDPMANDACEPPNPRRPGAAQVSMGNRHTNVGKPGWEVSFGVPGVAFTRTAFAGIPGEFDVVVGDCCGTMGPRRVEVRGFCAQPNDVEPEEVTDVGTVEFQIDITGMECCQGLHENGREGGTCRRHPGGNQGDCDTCCNFPGDGPEFDNDECVNTQFA